MFISYLYGFRSSKMINFIFQFICHFHYYDLKMACSPIGSISSLDRALRPVMAKAGIRFLLKPDFFSFFFFIFNRFFIQLRGSCSLDQFLLIPSSPQLSVAIPSCNIWTKCNIGPSCHNILDPSVIKVPSLIPAASFKP